MWGWVPCTIPRHRVSGLWANVLRVGGEASMGGEVFSKGVGFLKGEGS